MNREAYKLARDTLRKAVKEYGWSRRARGHFNLETGARVVTSRHYAADAGKFEGEHWSIVHWYDAMLNGMGDEPLMSGEECVADLFEVSDLERIAFGLGDAEQFAVLWHSSQGFESLEYIDANRYDELRGEYAEPDDSILKLTAPSEWASYLINGDDSGIDDADKAAADAWIAAVGLGDPVGCDDAGFIHHHDAYAQCPLGADCQTYVFHREG